ncbi:MinD/ParA family ATP-binding protein [Haloarcula onubensis]|uniref:P-loop NTPase n=1 Tax=Haloarcula onubensis TaxID=2950539 RepID=A0ABU2FTT1_9EURY|nr:P-loop NTPase [Halomicroarcula sp. S3CR25-11]MDS0283712.1 P-loop NTPase [Halomicroarcula sp. S3CR25-11]
MTGAHCITIAGGKGGCGKTTTAVNTAYALSDAGFDVVVVDTDLAMPNLHTVLGTSHEPTIHDVLADAEPLEAAIDTRGDVAAVYGDPSLDRYTDADPAGLKTVCNRLRTAFDVVVLDTGAGVTHATMVPCGLADDVVLTTTAKEHGVADTTRTKEMAEHVDSHIPGVVVTRADDETGRDIADRLETRLLAAVPDEPEVFGTEPVVRRAPDSMGAAAYGRVAEALAEGIGADES